MGMNITQMPCNPGNYTARRSSAIRYLVVHYTGAPGTARNNGAYFASRGDIGASAHYFVDAQDIVQSVPDSGRAWHLNCTPFVRQYDILSNKWGVYYAKRNSKQTV